MPSVAEEKDVSNVEILAELIATRHELARLAKTVDDLLHDFGPVLEAFRPRNGNGRAGYIEMAGAARALRRQQRGKDG